MRPATASSFFQNPRSTVRAFCAMVAGRWIAGSLRFMARDYPATSLEGKGPMSTDDGDIGRAQPLARLLGVEIVEASKARVVGRLLVRPDICTTWDTLHGGAIMAFADTLGATGAYLNLPPGAGTTTMESKTKLNGPGKGGLGRHGGVPPNPNGRRPLVWQTRITREDGKLVAVVTQT